MGIREIMPREHRDKTFLSRRIAEESQLLAEERWLLEALTKIRAQRNSLQIERLHLESMKARLMINPDNKPSEKPLQPIPTPSAEDIMLSVPSRSRTNFEVPLNEEYFCNREQLNLGVATSSISHPPQQPGVDELSMEEFDDDDDDCDNLPIDMGMLMGGQQHDHIRNRDLDEDDSEFILP